METIDGGVTHRLNQFPLFQQRFFVLDVILAGPPLDLVTRPLQLLDLLLESIFQFILLRSIRGLCEFVVDSVERLNAFCDSFEFL